MGRKEGNRQPGTKILEYRKQEFFERKMAAQFGVGCLFDFFCCNSNLVSGFENVGLFYRGRVSSINSRLHIKYATSTAPLYSNIHDGLFRTQFEFIKWRGI